MGSMQEDANRIIKESIKEVLPDAAVKKALESQRFEGKKEVVVVAIGKAAWNMAIAAKEVLGARAGKGIVITKHDHVKGPIEGFEMVEAGHPIPDGNSVLAAQKALALVAGLGKDDQVVLLISGGGSALFELPLPGLSLEDIMDVTDQLMSCGADIVEINAVRKHLSAVKGGRFAKSCGDASIYAVVLSDVIGDRLDAIASGPAYPDSSTTGDAMAVIDKYGLEVGEHILETLKLETPKQVDNCTTVVTGSVSELCNAAAASAERLGYKPLVLTSRLDGEAREAGRFMASIAQDLAGGSGHGGFWLEKPCAVIAGGETIVHLRGRGKGGRNQELALSAAIAMEGLENAVLFALGSDGTDGPTDAAGGLVDGTTAAALKAKGMQPEVYLDDNDAYHALKAVDGLVMTGATGTNVNDVVVLLCK